MAIIPIDKIAAALAVVIPFLKKKPYVLWIWNDGKNEWVSAGKASARQCKKAVKKFGLQKPYYLILSPNLRPLSPPSKDSGHTPAVG